MLIFFVVLLLLLLIVVCLYLLVRSRSSPFARSKHAVRYSVVPSLDVVTRQVPGDHPSRRSLIFNPLDDLRHSSTSLLNKSLNLLSIPSSSVSTGLFVGKTIHRRQSSIIDSKQIAQIEFSLPQPSEMYRRRSVAICSNFIDSNSSAIDSIIESIKSSTQFLPCLLSFSLIWAAELKIVFHSFVSLPVLQQLTIKVKLLPEGKVKSLQLKKLLDKEKIFDENEEYSLRFSPIAPGKLLEKALLIKVHGKDPQKRTVPLGQIGKIFFNQLKEFPGDQPLHFVHELEKIKPVSGERESVSNLKLQPVSSSETRSRSSTFMHSFISLILKTRPKPEIQSFTNLHSENFENVRNTV